ncbi:ABC transporter substrate-binding protein [Nonomuraea sp. KM90]|uniref:ABC transporter substrate-binding protein n=1 Tax=Nonomuraea sp. KM90 TaxID=3457428 RepID=UPI003FCE1090
MTRRPLLAAVLAALLLTCSAACGGAPSTPSAAPSDKAVTLGFSAWPGWFPWQVAQEKGLFARNGVQVELKYFDSYTDSLTALATGNIDANSQTLNDTLASVSGGARQTVVLVNDNSTGNDQIIARPGITSVAQLKGRTVAAEQGTVDHYLLLLALREAGLTPADVTFKPLPTDAAAAAFKAGQVDAVGVFAPFTTTALELPGSAAIATSKEFPGAIPDHLVVSRALASSRPEVVQGLVKTWFDTVAWIGANKAEARTIMARRAGVSEQDYAEYDAGTTIFSLADNREAFGSGSLERQAKEIAAFLTESGLADTAPSLDGLLDPRFVQGVSS